MKLRDIPKKFLRFMVGGMGIAFIVWWHPDGILYKKYGYRVVYDALDAKLSSVMNGKDWEWQPARSDEVVNIQISYRC